MSAELSLKDARRLALAAQGFTGRQPPALIKAAHVNRLIDRLGILQIDSVNALVRSHYLPLFSRLGIYAHPLLDRAAWGRGRQRKLFEYWGMKRRYCRSACIPYCDGACAGRRKVSVSIRTWRNLVVSSKRPLFECCSRFASRGRWVRAV